MLWKLTYVTPQGDVAYLTLDAEDQAAAIAASKVPPARIRKVSKALGGLFSSAPPVQDQITFLAALGAAVSSGRSSDEEFLELMQADAKLKKKQGEVAGKTLTSERMRALNFDATAIMLTEVGERSGTLGESISSAAEMMTEAFKIQREMSKGAKGQIFLLVLLALVFVGLPYQFYPIFHELESSDGIKITRTFATHTLFGVKAFVDYFWWGILAALAAAWWYRAKIWVRLRDKPVFSQMNELNKCQRAVQFINSYLPLDLAGVPALEMLQRLKSFAKGEDLELYKFMIAKVQQGYPLSESFDPTYMPNIFIRSCHGIESSERMKRRDTLLLLRRNLLTKIEIIANGVIVTFKMAGWVMLGLVITFMMYGIYIPLVTISAF